MPPSCGTFCTLTLAIRSICRTVGQRNYRRNFPGFGTTWLAGIFSVRCRWESCSGIIAAHKRGKPLDYLLVGFAVLGVSVPVFIIASLLQYVFAIKLQWLPVAQWKSFAYTILPTLTLSFGSIAGRTRTMRTLMLEVISEDYVKTRKGKRTFFSNDHLAAPDPQCNYSADSNLAWRSSAS